MKKLRSLYDEKYLKISLYVIGTLIVTFILGIITYGLSKDSDKAYSFISSILKPMFLGIAIAYLLAPLTRRFEEKVFKNSSKKRLLAVLFTYLVLILFILGIITVLLITITKSVTAIDFEQILHFTDNLESDLDSFWAIVQKQLAEFNIDISNFTSKIGAVAGGISSFASTMLFANIFAIYFLLDHSIAEYWADIFRLIASDKQVAKSRELLADLDKVFSGYIRGQSLDALSVGVISSICLLIAGIPYAVVIGLLTGIGNLIPYFGPIVGFASLAIVCISEGSLIKLVVGLAVLALVMAIDSNVINPRLLSNNVEVHPLLVVVALMAGSQVGGLIGMLVAVPTAAFFKLQFDKYIAKKRALKKEQAEA